MVENNSTSSNNISFDEAKDRAAHVIAKMIAGTPLNHQGAGGQFIQNPEVKISLSPGFSTSVGPSSDTPNMEVVNIEFSNLGEHIASAQGVITQVLEKMPVLPSHIKFGDEEKEADTTYALTSELIDKGAELTKNILKWSRFSHANNETRSKWETARHTTNTQTDGHGVTIHINMPKHLNAGMTMDDIKKNFESRKDQILNTFADRIAKYKGVRGDKNEEAKIREALNMLEFEVHSTGTRIDGEDTRSGSMYITLRTADQKAAKGVHDKDHPNDPVEANPKLEAGNILQTIKPQELAKSAARAILSENEKDADITMAIIGGKDVYRILEKQLNKFKAAKPEFAEKVDEVLASTLFKENGYDTPEKNQHEVKQPISFDVKDSKDKIKIALPLPKDHASKFIREVAAMADAEVLTAPAQTQAKPDLHQFASVDSMELVGVHTKNPAVQQMVQQAAAPLAGKPVPADQAEGFATNIINLIEQAYKQVQDGKRALASGIAAQADQKFEQVLTQDVQAAEPAPQPLVTPSSIVSNQEKKLDINDLNWAEKLAAIAGQKPHGAQLGA